MLEREYYTNKNMVGRDKLFFILRRKYGDKAPTQKAINDWLINQKPHQLLVQSLFCLRTKCRVRSALIGHLP